MGKTNIRTRWINVKEAGTVKSDNNRLSEYSSRGQVMRSQRCVSVSKIDSYELLWLMAGKILRNSARSVTGNVQAVIKI